MKTNQRFTLLVFSLSCMTCAGTTLALVSLDVPLENSAQDLQKADELRPSLVGALEPLAVPHHQLVTRLSRLAFVRAGFGSLELPREIDVAAANPESWSIEVKAPPPTSPKPQNSVSETRSGSAKKKTKSRYTLKERLAEISPAALGRVIAKFASAKASWPPEEIALVAIKDEKALEVYSRPTDGAWKFVHRYRVLAASGASGPKLQRGDKQVPEGVYRISYLNPNSAYHVSLRVNYPNTFDRKMARKDGRKNLGGDIMIHGENVSAGCLAVGNASVEELFVLTAEVGMRNVKVVIAPTDFRRNAIASRPKGPEWVPTLYTEIASAMSEFKGPPPPSLLTLLGL